MFLALLADVHDNVRDLERMLSYLQRRQVDAFLQLGDLGVQALPLLDGLPVQHVFGNWEVSGLTRFPAQRQTEVSAWPAHLGRDDWLATHATPAFPSECHDLAATRAYMARNAVRWTQLFPSLLHDEHAIIAALAEMAARHCAVVFHGHTHVQAVQQFDPQHLRRRVFGPVIDLLPDTRTLIGVGSVGVPRDGNQPRCVLFDPSARQIELVALDTHP